MAESSHKQEDTKKLMGNGDNEIYSDIAGIKKYILPKLSPVAFAMGKAGESHENDKTIGYEEANCI